MRRMSSTSRTSTTRQNVRTRREVPVPRANADTGCCRLALFPIIRAFDVLPLYYLRLRLAATRHVPLPRRSSTRHARRRTRVVPKDCHERRGAERAGRIRVQGLEANDKTHVQTRPVRRRPPVLQDAAHLHQEGRHAQRCRKGDQPRPRLCQRRGRDRARQDARILRGDDERPRGAEERGAVGSRCPLSRNPSQTESSRVPVRCPDHSA